ncbi:MAG TPA: alkaline phosphatase family protein [Acidobacteriaceae bacterium]|nr:alkaline phosphatase family protein [Acidobacteriaceae bacterium]
MLSLMSDCNAGFRAAASCLLASLLLSPGPSLKAQTPERRNVIIFVADGLRRGSVNAEDTPTFWAVRTRGVDFRNSHSVFPTFTTANASAIATGHGLGDTGDYSNVIWPGVWLTRPESLNRPGVPATAGGYVTPFLENDEVLANMNAAFDGNYLGEATLLSVAQAKGFAVASVGKLGPTAIQQNSATGWDPSGELAAGSAVIVDDSTGQVNASGEPLGFPLPQAVLDGMEAQHLRPVAPLRTNGYGDADQGSNGFFGDAKSPGTLAANLTQQQWFADVATRVLLPQFVADKKSFVLLFWSRDPDGTQHNQGDSLQQVRPGINGPTSKLALRNADHDLKQLMDWLDAHPAVKANTDVILTSDHGFATVSRREIAADGSVTGEPSALLDYNTWPREKAQTKGTLPTGFLAIDLGIREHLRVFDAGHRSDSAPSVFRELAVGGERSDHPEMGSALLSTGPVQRLDGTDAQLIVAANGGSDLIYAPTRDAGVVRRTVAALAGLDYVGGIFADESYCGETMADCPGALPLKAIGLNGSSKLPRPAIAVAFKVSYPKPGDLQNALQISDTTLQEGQGMHGGFGREQTWNNMAAIGPDFKKGFVDEAPVGNVDIVPTLAKILKIDLPSVGSLKGRVASEALKGGTTVKLAGGQVLTSAPANGGLSTVLEFQEMDGVRYYDRACFVKEKRCE